MLALIIALTLRVLVLIFLVFNFFGAKYT